LFIVFFFFFSVFFFLFLGADKKKFCSTPSCPAASPTSPVFVSPYAQRKPVLPVLSRQQASHPDLSCITAETLADVFRGQYNDKITQLVIIDARFAYEVQWTIA
jgi:ABC-type multidrug transport system permease subunit